MTAKEYLGQAYRLDQRINSKIEQIASLNELATRCTSTLTGMPRNPSPSVSPMADAICKIIDLEAEINRDIEKLVDLKRDIVRIIKAVDNIKQHPLCEMCQKEGRLTPVDEVHHIVPVSQGGKSVESNLMSLCHSCHTKIHIEIGDRHTHG